MEGILRAWGTILTGRRPCLSIEVTRECPLSCPGCYAYGTEHLGDRVTLRDLSDYKQDELVDRILALVRAERPLHVSLVGGEPLVRFREMSTRATRAVADGHLDAAGDERRAADPAVNGPRFDASR